MRSKATYKAAEVVREPLLVRAEVKAVVYGPVRYSGHKTSLSQVVKMHWATQPASR